MNSVPRKWLILGALVTSLFSGYWYLQDFDPKLGLAFLASLGFLIQQVFFPNINSSQTSGFIAGKRLKWCRKQFHLTPSEMAEQLNIDSETNYRLMENGQSDVPLEALEKLAKFRGVSLEWLKHGNLKDELRRRLWDAFPRITDTLNISEPQWKSYEIKDLLFCDKETVVEALKEVLVAKPDQLYFAINPNSCGSVYLISQRDEHYTLWDLHALDFWNEYAWGSDLNYLPYLYSFYHGLAKHEGIHSQGLFLNEEEMRSLYLGNLAPENIIRSAWIREHETKQFSNISHWPEDLLDYKHLRSPASRYRDWYGDWIVKTHSYFQRYIEKNTNKPSISD